MRGSDPSANYADQWQVAAKVSADQWQVPANLSAGHSLNPSPHLQIGVVSSFQNIE